MREWWTLNEVGTGVKWEGGGRFHSLFSNFESSPVVIGGLRYRTVEHYYQSMKTEDPGWREAIRTAVSPGAAKVIGRQAPLREDWEEARVGVMLTGLRFKFARPQFSRVLAGFPGTITEWNSWHDRIWGVCTCNGCGGTGSNLLGYCLERVRSELLADGGGCWS